TGNASVTLTAYYLGPPSDAVGQDTKCPPQNGVGQACAPGHGMLTYTSAATPFEVVPGAETVVEPQLRSAHSVLAVFASPSGEGVATLQPAAGATVINDAVQFVVADATSAVCDVQLSVAQSGIETSVLLTPRGCNDASPTPCSVGGNLEVQGILA